MMSLIINDSKTYDTKNIILICCYCFAFNDTFMFIYSATMVSIWILWKIICTYGIYDICMVYIYKSTGHVLGPTADNPTRNYDTEEIDMAIEKDNVEISSQKVS